MGFIQRFLLPPFLLVLLLVAGCAASPPRQPNEPLLRQVSAQDGQVSEVVMQAYGQCARDHGQCYPCDGPGLHQVPVERASAFCPTPGQQVQGGRQDLNPPPQQTALLNMGDQRIPRSQFKFLQPPLPDGGTYSCDQATGDYVPGSNETCNLIRRQQDCCARVVEPPAKDCCDRTHQQQERCCDRVARGPAVVRPLLPPQERPDVVEPRPQASPAPPRPRGWCDTCNGPSVQADSGGVAFGTNNKDNKVYVFMPGSNPTISTEGVPASADGRPSVIECPKGKCSSVTAHNGSVAFGRGNEGNTVIPIPPGSTITTEGNVKIEQRDPK